MIKKDLAPSGEILPPGVRRLLVNTGENNSTHLNMFMPNVLLRHLNSKLAAGEKLCARIDNLEKPGHWSGETLNINGHICLVVDNESTLESIITRYGHNNGLFGDFFAVQAQPNLF